MIVIRDWVQMEVKWRPRKDDIVLAKGAGTRKVKLSRKNVQIAAAAVDKKKLIAAVKEKNEAKRAHRRNLDEAKRAVREVERLKSYGLDDEWAREVVSAHVSVQEEKLKAVLSEIARRKKYLGITTFDWKRIGGQKELVTAYAKESMIPPEDRKRYTLYYGWNGSGKTAIWAFVTSVMAMGNQGKAKYGLPWLGEKKCIWIVTKSGANVVGTIEPYLLGDNSVARIPPDEIKERGLHYDNKILKRIELRNGSRIFIFTYDQGRENLQGGNPDFIWLDEEPTRQDIWDELQVRIRSRGCSLLVTMTPLSGLTPIYEFFFEASQEAAKYNRVIQVSSLDNPFTDKAWTQGKTAEWMRLRVEGSFENPSWLVYNEFHRGKHVIPHVPPEEMGPGVRHYRSIDFGTTHPTACLMVSQDADNNLYVWDEVYRSDTLMEDIAKEIKAKSGNRKFEMTVRDSAAKREGLELQRYGIQAVPADKRTKVSDMSNRRAGIMRINQLLASGKLFISDRCVNLVKEFSSHYYKEGGRDGEVIKVNDDALDALRYLVFLLRDDSPMRRTHSVERKAASTRPKKPITMM